MNSGKTGTISLYHVIHPILQGNHKMTTIYNEQKKCPNCGTLNEITMVGSTNSFGSMDLDTRPPEMRRSTMIYWLESCTHCGLSVSDLSKVEIEALKYFKSDNFKQKHTSEKFKSLAGKFWTSYLLVKNSGDINSALGLIHCAAWASDDMKDSHGSTRAREIFIETLQENGNDPSILSPSEPLAGYLMLSDINRRISRFDEAKRLAQHVVDNGEGFLQQIAEFVVELCEKKDSHCYNVDGERVVF